jgi:hypothetical protein
MSSPASPSVTRLSPVNAVVENGTSLMFCSRRVAVTTISPRSPEEDVSVATAASATFDANSVTATPIRILFIPSSLMLLERDKRPPS